MADRRFSEATQHSQYSQLPSRGADGDPESDTQRLIKLQDYNRSSIRRQSVRGTGVEEPKIALGRMIEFKRLWIHFLALGATAAVLQLSFRNVYWYDDGKAQFNGVNLDKDETANLLQFVAKFHEIIVLASLSTMVLHVVRRMLVGKKGISFGHLTAGYQASAPEYLFSKSLWSPFGKTARDTIFTVLMAITIVYANFVGPSAAIVLLPNLDWWEVRSPFNNQPFTTFLTRTTAQMFPSTLNLDTDSQYLNSSSSCLSANYSSLCPAGGFYTLEDWAAANFDEGIAANVSMVDSSSDTRRLAISSYADSVAIATTVPASIARLAGFYWLYIQGRKDLGVINSVTRPLFSSGDGSASLSAPVVQVQCKTWNYLDVRSGLNGATANNVLWPVGELNVFGGSAYNPNVAIDQTLFNFSRAVNATNFTWANISPLGSGSPSLGAVVSIPQTINSTNGLTQSGLVVPCSIDARWAAASFSYDPTQNDLVMMNITNTSSFGTNSGEANQKGKYGVSDAISINTTWAKMLNVLWDDDYPNFTIMDYLLNRFVQGLGKNQALRSFSPPQAPMPQTADDTSYQDAVTNTVAQTLSMVVTEGLARAVFLSALPKLLLNNDPANYTILDLDYITGAYANKPDEKQNPSITDDWSQISWEVQRYGWGYGWNQSHTITFGIIILLIHSGLTIIYMFYSVGFWAKAGFGAKKRGWASKAWAESGEMIALALVSPDQLARDALGNVGAGLENKKTWRKVVRIMEGPQDKLELTVGDPDAAWEESMELEDVKVDKKYR